MRCPAGQAFQLPIIAFALLVYRDYTQIERFFSLYVRPGVLFCFGLDKNAEEIFKNRMLKLHGCFPLLTRAGHL